MLFHKKCEYNMLIFFVDNLVTNPYSRDTVTGCSKRLAEPPEGRPAGHFVLSARGESTGCGPAGEETGMSLQKILVVDDEQPITQLIQEGLEMEGGYTVRRASNGREGVELYKNFLPDLVIMDVNMPIMDGYQSSKEIKAFDPDARILVLTGNAQDARARRIMEEGIALTLLQKPLRLWQLARIVQDNLPRPC